LEIVDLFKKPGSLFVLAVYHMNTSFFDLHFTRYF